MLSIPSELAKKVDRKGDTISKTCKGETQISDEAKSRTFLESLPDTFFRSQEQDMSGEKRTSGHPDLWRQVTEPSINWWVEWWWWGGSNTNIYVDVGGDPNRPLKHIVSDMEEPQQAA
ncbi:hypothetical protein EYF80_046924 [Liparis tanakae]|uniref:Uncharacterized protein n=1 Tax=Liparis tanakae TaxID=230148 RepID=A0A4Z2FNS1_9TELE|nr:hypothetical protein EYF80_046924 [Liparis tanakae]